MILYSFLNSHMFLCKITLTIILNGHEVLVYKYIGFDDFKENCKCFLYKKIYSVVFYPKREVCVYLYD